jgi:hypothetical protein
MSKIIFFYSILQVSAYYVSAQECSAYVPFVKGFTSETQEYRKGAKPNGKTILTVVDVQSAANEKIAIIETKSLTPKGELSGPGTRYTVTCSNGITKIDTRAALSAPPDADVKEERGACFTELPATIEVGHTFEECLFSYKRKGAYFETRLFNRKITGKETVTVAAGTFEAFVIEYDMTTMMKQGIDAIFTKHHRDWYAPGKGLVKAENFQPGRKQSPYKPGDSPFFYSELITFK